MTNPTASAERCPYCGFSPLPDVSKPCPKCQTESRKDSGSITQLRPIVVPAKRRTPTLKETPIADEGKATSVELFRPVMRPPMAIIKLFYDGSTSQGHEIPVFQDAFIIGREEADLVVAHDTLISKRHARLFRSHSRDGMRWVLEDLQSTNGTFASIDQGILQNRQEILLGSRRYRFELPNSVAPPLPRTTDRKQTSLWRPPTAGDTSLPSLVEVDQDQDGKRHELTGKEVKIGSDDEACQLLVTDDPFLSAEHARIRQDERGRWIITPINALNGVWARIRSIQVAKTGLFQIGEQRISIRVP